MIQLIKDLIEGGFVGQAIIATLLIATACFLAATGKEVPQWLIGLAGLVTGWFFRSQAQVIAERREIRRQEKWASWQK